MCEGCAVAAIWGAGLIAVAFKFGFWGVVIYAFLSFLAGWRLMEWLVEQ